MTNGIGLNTTVNNTSSFYYINDEQLMDLADKHKIPVSQLCIWADRANKPDGSTAPLEDGDIIVLKNIQDQEAKAEAEAKAAADKEAAEEREAGQRMVATTTGVVVGAVAVGATVSGALKGAAALSWAGPIGWAAGAIAGGIIGFGLAKWF